MILRMWRSSSMCRSRVTAAASLAVGLLGAGCDATRRVEVIELPNAVSLCLEKVRDAMPIGASRVRACLYVSDGARELCPLEAEFAPAGELDGGAEVCGSTASCGRLTAWEVRPGCEVVLEDQGQTALIAATLALVDGACPLTEPNACRGSVLDDVTAECLTSFSYSARLFSGGQFQIPSSGVVSARFSSLFREDLRFGRPRSKNVDIKYACGGLMPSEEGALVSVSVIPDGEWAALEVTSDPITLVKLCQPAVTRICDATYSGAVANGRILTLTASSAEASVEWDGCTRVVGDRCELHVGTGGQHAHTIKLRPGR